MPKVFLPFIRTNKGTVRKSINVGIDATGINSLLDSQRFISTGIDTAMVGGFPFRNVIQSNFALDLSKAAKVNTVESLLVGNGIQLMLNLHGAPDWMKRSPTGPLQPKFFDKYAELCATVAQRYSSISQFQIWNEPDFDTGIPGAYGCWGWAYMTDYILLLGKCRKAIKAVRPDAKITVGLGMTDANCLNFLRCFKQAGGLSLIDYLNFHHYGYYGGQPIRDASWLTNDPLQGIAMKIDRIKYYTEDFPLQLTETNLIYDSPSTPTFEMAKAAFLLNTFIIAAHKGCETVMAYSWRASWRNTNVAGLDAEEAMKLLTRIYSVK